MTLESIQARSAVYGWTSLYQRGHNRLTAANSTSFGDKAQTDTVSLSSAGSCLSSLITDLHGVESNQDGSIRLEDIRQKFQENSSGLGRELTTLLQNAGIDTGTAMEFRVDSQGKVVEVSGHPQKDEIESLLNDEYPEAANQMRRQSAMASLLKAAEQHSEFAAAYAKDPEAAVERYAGLFSEYHEAMTLTLDGGRLLADGQERA